MSPSVCLDVSVVERSSGLRSLKDGDSEAAGADVLPEPRWSARQGGSSEGFGTGGVGNGVR